MMFPVSAYINCSQVLENGTMSCLFNVFLWKDSVPALWNTKSNMYCAGLSNWRLIKGNWTYALMLSTMGGGERMSLKIQLRMWAMTLFNLRIRLMSTQILLLGCGSRNPFDIFWGSDTNNGAWNTKSFFTISPWREIFSQVQPRSIFSKNAKPSKGMKCYLPKKCDHTYGRVSFSKQCWFCCFLKYELPHL